MKKVLLSLSLSLTAYVVSAQSLNFGIRGGLNTATVNRGPLSSGNETKSLARLNAGLFANIGFSNWSIEPGLFYSQKGFIGNSDYTTSPLLDNNVIVNNFKVKATVKYNYLELPVNVLYNMKLAPGKIFFGGGLYVGYLLSGNYKVVSTSDGTVNPEQTGNYRIGSKGDLKRTDFGINGLAGFAFNNNLQLSAGYGYGFTNVLTNPSDFKIRNRVFNISVGYSL